MRDERKNARPEAATSGRAKRESTRESGNSRNQHTTAADGGQGVVSSLRHRAHEILRAAACIERGG